MQTSVGAGICEEPLAKTDPSWLAINKARDGRVVKHDHASVVSAALDPVVVLPTRGPVCDHCYDIDPRHGESAHGASRSRIGRAEPR